MKSKEITIIGAGLVGSLLSIFLAKRGYQISVYERRPDMRKTSIAAGRSINLALSDRGIKALEAVGIMDSIREISIPMHGRLMHGADGKMAYQAYGKEGQFINSVSRGELNKKLMDLAEAHGVQFNFNHRCDAIDWKAKTASFLETQTQEEKKVPFERLFGSDGAYSAARLQFQLQHDRFQYQQYFIDFGYKELHIPPLYSGGFQMEKNALHIWPRGNYMLIALPNLDGSFTCTLFFPFEGNPSFDSLKSEKEVRIFFDETFADASAMMPGLEKDFFVNPTTSLVTVRCFPWVKSDFFALIGDGAHAIVPFFGQGMNCGFEDCLVLDNLLETNGENWEKTLQAYQQQRKPDADAIAELALNNFVEMRDKVADPTFLFQKKIEAELHKLFPADWIPAYTQVTFRPDIRYSEALKNGKIQDEIMQTIMKDADLESKWQNADFLQSIIDLKKKTLAYA